MLIHYHPCLYFSGDGYPLCADFPGKMFLRFGARYDYLGDSNLPKFSNDPVQFLTDPSTKKFVLPDNSHLRLKLCNPDQKGTCRYSSTVVLASDLPCFGLECNVETVRVVQVGDVFYEYVRRPCVHSAFFNNAIKVIRSVDTEPITCANPALLEAAAACCDMSSTLASRFVIYDGERSTFTGATQRCFDFNQTLCNMKVVHAPNKFKLSSYHWTTDTCKVMCKVSPSGTIAIVYEPSIYTAVDALVNIASENWFKVYWDGGSYPIVEDNCSSYCRTYLDVCICEIFVETGQVFQSMPSSKVEALANLHIGSLDPEIYYRGAFTSILDPSTGITAYLSGAGKIDTTTIFTFFDDKQRRHILKNVVNTVRLTGFNGSSPMFSFRNPPHFISLVPTEASVG